MSDNTRDDHPRIIEAIRQYVSARQALIALGNEFPTLIGGNDNMIGRIGEYYAILFLRSVGQTPQRVDSASNPGYDLADGPHRTQVKVLSHENTRGRSVRLSGDWTQFLLMLFNDAYEPEAIGLLTRPQFDDARRDNPNWSETPVVKTSMLGPRGLIGRYGRVDGPTDFRELIASQAGR